MRYETIEQLNDRDFKRLTGVQRETFVEMLKVIEKGLRRFGRPPKLSRADQLLMTLMYWREYRTEFHIAQSYGVSEATVCRTLRKVEDALAGSKKFRLPGKKALQPSDTVFEVILVDASEMLYPVTPFENAVFSENNIAVSNKTIQATINYLIKATELNALIQSLQSSRFVSEQDETIRLTRQFIFDQADKDMPEIVSILKSEITKEQKWWAGLRRLAESLRRRNSA